MKNVNPQTSNIIIVIAIVGAIILALWAIPQYRVYTLEMQGKAQLKEAEWNRQILIEEANAKKQAARLEAQAEVERAKGVAEANQIIGDSLKENEAYLRYLWIQGLRTSSSQVVYVPTEANLPILEASRGGTLQ